MRPAPGAPPGLVEVNDAHAVGKVEAGEVVPQARVRRSRLAFALSATVAALPVLVLDNMSATAAPDEVRIVAAEGYSSSTDEPTTSSTTEQPTTTAVVVVAEAVAEATTTSESAPETTTTAGVVATQPAVESSADPEPAPPPAPTTTQSPPTPSSEGHAYGDPDDPATWDRLARCESGGNWAANTGNGYYGGLQFSLGSWQDVGGSGYPHEHSREEQIQRGRNLQARYGWSQWPHCSAKLGYR